MDFTGYYDFDTSILSIANDFYEAYHRCTEGKNTHIDKWGRTVESGGNVPVLVNGSFACELYLKSLLPPGTTGHLLYDLYMLLDENTRISIKKYCDERIDFINYDFDTTLKDFSNAFVFWRYIHEQNGNLGTLGLNLGLRFLSHFVEILKLIANDKKEI